MTARTRRKRVCLVCRELRPHSGRGLCSTCRSRETVAGRLDTWPPVGRNRGPGALNLADPAAADEAAVAQALDRDRRRLPVHVLDHHDRAAVVQLVAAGTVGPGVAARVLHCSNTSLRRYIALLPTLTVREAV